MPNYRDYVDLNTSDPNHWVDTNRKGQVYLATHEGELRLSLMNRSFISFTYGGKHIEDFNLIATISNDRLQRNGYASFNDTTTTYDNLDGQYYWGTHYKTNELNFVLSTDGIDQPTLDEFLHWFHPGQSRELILAEHPNRAILARVAEPPQISLLPFEHPVSMTINAITYQTKTTLYKGDITLRLIMDEPHWYAKDNLLGMKENNHYVDTWIDANGNTVSIFASQDALKILYEDGIPLGSMIDSNMLLGNGVYATVEDNAVSMTWSELQHIDGTTDIETITNEDFNTGEGAMTCTYIKDENDQDTDEIDELLGIIAGAIMNANGEGIDSLSGGDSDADGAYFYYSGTAPAYTIISFDLQPILSNQDYRVLTPGNSFNGDQYYNTITIESEYSQKMILTTPNILTSYNQVINIFKMCVEEMDEDEGKYKYSWEDIRENIRDKVRHQAVREWASKVIDSVAPVQDDNENNNETRNVAILYERMSWFLKDANGTPYIMHFSFNSQFGEALGWFQYRIVDNSIPASDEWAAYNAVARKRNFSNDTKEYFKEEDVGDMLRSNYLIIRERNYPNVNGRIVGWNQGHQFSHRITHDFASPMENLSILYKNMYL